MLSDETYAFLIDLAHWRARQPHEVIAAFCPCSMSASTGACSRRRTGALARGARSRSRRCCSVRGKSSDPDGPSRPNRHLKNSSRRAS